MKSIAVVYWSGTGNTEAMANAVAKGARGKGASVNLTSVDGFDAGKLDSYDAVAFGCPAMGAEELEDGEFAPVFEACEPNLSGKKVGLFGSYGWGGGDWMRNWEETVKGDGAELVGGEGVICCEAPDDEALAACQALGAALAE